MEINKEVLDMIRKEPNIKALKHNMTRKEFIQNIENTYSDAVKILRKKNADYANSGNPFKNFEFAKLVGIGVERAILVRMSDKFARISNLVDKENEVKDETVSDTLEDLINYTAILKAYLEQEHYE